MHEPDKHFSRHYTDSLNLNSIQFKWGLDRLLKRFTMAPEDICGWLQSSLLVSNTRMPLIEAGVKAHFSGDFFKALHILVPQIEEMLRQLLRLFEISRSKSVRGQTGATELKNISDILRIPRIVEALDEDLYMFLLHLLVSKPGFNLRNDLAHGIAPVESFNELTSGLILQCVILLGAIRDEATVLDMSAS